MDSDLRRKYRIRTLLKPDEDPELFVIKLLLLLAPGVKERPVIHDANGGRHFITIIVDEATRDEIRTRNYIDILGWSIVFDEEYGYIN